MKIPKTLNIFSVNWKVIMEKDYFINSDIPDMLLCGDCDFNNRKVNLGTVRF